ncbi:MAG: hypothetical protein IJT97_04465, partial [Bacteroidaceae bacterium]|nr:hypothetical protein [Bacteroidaceae bacterium]
RELAISEMNVTVNSSDNEVVPVTYYYDNIYYENDESKLFIIKNAQFADSLLASREVTLLDEDNNGIILYDRFDILKTNGFNVRDTYNVTGLLTQYVKADATGNVTVKLQIYVTGLKNLTSNIDTIHIANQPTQPYTVAQARQFIDTALSGEAIVTFDDTVYVKGTVYNIKSLDPEKYDNAQYYIKGEQETDTFYVYNGKYINGLPFTKADQLQLNDEVIVAGTITSYTDKNGKTEYEFTANNYIWQLTRDGVVLEPDTAQTDTTVVLPDPYIAVGDGTKENPYTIEDVINLYNINFAQLGDASIVNTDTVWVKGTILGTVNSQTGATIYDIDSTTVAYNLSVGTPNATFDEHISVQLPSEKDAPGVRAGLNLVDNPEILGMEVLLQGIITQYCRVPGLKPTLGYEFVGDDPHVLTVEDITDLIDAYLQQEAGGNITVEDITNLIDQYLNQTNE